jgi:hypothetical protein
MSREISPGEDAEATYKNPNSYRAASKIAFNDIAAQMLGEGTERYLAAHSNDERLEIMREYVGQKLIDTVTQELKDAGFDEGIRMGELTKTIRQAHEIYKERGIGYKVHGNPAKELGKSDPDINL